MTDNDNATGAGSGPRSRRERVVGRTPSIERRYLDASTDAEEHVHLSAEEREPRTSDVDAKSDRRAERTVVFFFLLAGAAGVAFMVAFVLTDVGGMDSVQWSNHWLGLTMAVSFFAIGAGIVHWVRRLMPQEEGAQERDPLPSSMAEKKTFNDYFMTGAEATGITRRPMLRRSLLAALVPLGVAPLFLLRGLGAQMPFEGMHHTVWRRGLRLVVYGTNEPVRPADFATPGSLLTVIPEGYEHDLQVLAKATVQIIKMRPGELKGPETNLDWVVDGIVAYSKICTHVGCATGLYEDSTKYILCPCHQSTFDAARGCKVIFGPAARPLPQLPLGLDEEGYLVAMGDFPVPAGPSFWGRG